MLLLKQPVSSQEYSFVFTHLKEKDGLSDNTVNCIIKDSRGIMWIGTQNGLNRFDGSNFYTYKLKRNSNSLPDAGVLTLCEDKTGNIWGGTNNGIFCFIPTENRFVNYFPLDSRISNAILNILCDKDGTIWAGGWIHLLKFNQAVNKFENVVALSGLDSARQYSMRQNCLLMDPAGHGIWMASRTGMFYYDLKKKVLLNYRTQTGNPLFNNNNVNSLAVSPSGHYWYYDNGTNKITAFDPVQKKILFSISIEKHLPSAMGATIYEDQQKRIWFSSWGRETLMIDYRKNKIIRVDQKNNDALSIASGHSWSIFEDDDGTLWFGTLSGISRYNPDNSLFKVYRMPEQFEQFKNTSIYYIKEDPRDQSLWMVTSDGSLFHWRRELNKIEEYKLSKSKPLPDGSVPSGIANIKFFKNTIIVSTEKGIWQLQQGMKQLEPFNILPLAYSDFKPIHFIVSGDSVFYLSDQKKIIYLNVLSGKIKTINFDRDTLAGGIAMGAYGMVLDNANNMWAYCAGGWIGRIKNGKLVPVLVAKGNTGESLGYFNSMEADDKGNIWLPNVIAGLYAYNVNNDQIRYWDENDGLLTQAPGNAMPDRFGQVWTVKYNKVSVLLPGNRFNNFIIPLNENVSGYYNSIERLQNGNMLIGIYNDLVEFKAAHLNTKPAKKAPSISMVSASDKDYLITNENNLVLKPNENTLRFRFGILIDKETFPYELEYLLEGAEKNWTRTEGKVEAVYNNLAPGTYTFRVKARGKNNNWESDEATLLITIKTPFYKAAWFLLLIGLLALSIIVFIYRYRLAQKEKLMQLERKAQLLEKEKVMVMYESLKQQLNPHFLFNSLTSLSGLIETDQQVAGNFLEQMSGIYRYILKNGDNETVSLKDEIEFVQLYINLQQTRFKNGLRVNIDVPDEYNHYKIAPVTLQNLIENAIKHNIIDAGSPLVIEIFIQGDYLVVKNNLQRKNVVETSNKKGLAQFTSLYRYLSDLPVVIEETAKEFRIKIPLI